VAPLAEGVNVGAHVDRNSVPLGERIVLTVSVEGQTRDIRPPELPQLPEFRVQSGGSSQQVSWVNGDMTATFSFTYYLIPQREGQFTIPPIAVEADGSSYRSVEIPLVILAATAQAPPATRPSERRDSTEGGGDNQHLVMMTVSSDSVVVGEQIVLTFSFFRDPYGSVFESPEYTAPTTEGFWREDLPPERRATRVFRSRRYDVTEIRYAIFPTHAGELTVGEAVVRIPADLMGSFFRRRQQRQDVFLRAPAIPIQVRNLPARAPVIFQGTVGSDLQLRVSLDRDELAAGDALSLHLELEGDGYLASAIRPEIPELPGFRIHDAGSSVDSRPLGDVLHGKLSLDKLLIAEEAGDFEFPPLEYCYYDTRADRYRTIRSEALPIRVSPSDQGASAVFSSGARSEIEILAQDIRHIRPLAANAAAGAGPLPRRPLFWLLFATPPTLGAASSLLLRRREALLRDPHRVRRRKALALALQRIETGQIDAAVREYFGAYMHKEPAGLTQRAIAEWFARRGIDAQLGSELSSIFERCDRARYAGTSGGDAELAAAASEFLRRVEGGLGRV
jgi:hypothetical protein